MVGKAAGIPVVPLYIILAESTQMLMF